MFCNLSADKHTAIPTNHPLYIAVSLSFLTSFLHLHQQRTI